MSFDALPHDCWPEVAAALTQPWPSAAAAHDLRWHAAEHHVSGRRLPSVRELADRWGWKRSRAHELLASEAWKDEARPWGWRSDVDKPLDERTASGQSPDSERTSGTVESAESADFRTAGGQSPDNNRTHARNSSKHPTPYTVGDTILRPAAAVAPPASPPPVELFPAPPPEPDHAPAPSAKPARASKPKAPRAEKAPTPGYREAIDRWDRAYREAHDGSAYPYVFTGQQSDAAHVRTVLAAARYTEADAAGALDRIENAARAYMAAAALGRTFPRGEPVSLRWFARDIARWLRTDPREAGRDPNGRKSLLSDYMDRKRAEAEGVPVEAPMTMEDAYAMFFGPPATPDVQ